MTAPWLPVLLLPALAGALEPPPACRLEGGPGPATLRYRVADDFRSWPPQRILREIQSQLGDGSTVVLEGGPYPAEATLSLAARGRSAGWTLAQVALATGRPVALRRDGASVRWLPPDAAPVPAAAVLPRPPPALRAWRPCPAWTVVPVLSWGVGWRVGRHAWLGWGLGAPLGPGCR